MFGHPLFLGKHLFYVPCISRHVPNSIFAVRKCSYTKNAYFRGKVCLLGAKRIFFFLNSRDIPNERNALSRTANNP